MAAAAFTALFILAWLAAYNLPTVPPATERDRDHAPDAEVPAREHSRG